MHDRDVGRIEGAPSSTNAHLASATETPERSTSAVRACAARGPYAAGLALRVGRDGHASIGSDMRA